jgi:hypothetical protein
VNPGSHAPDSSLGTHGRLSALPVNGCSQLDRLNQAGRALLGQYELMVEQPPGAGDRADGWHAGGDADALYREGYKIVRWDPVGARLRTRRRSQARHLYERAAELGNIDAMTALGNLLRLYEPQTALSWWKRAADLGDPRAAFKAGLMVGPASAPAATERFEQANQLGLQQPDHAIAGLVGRGLRLLQRLFSRSRGSKPSYSEAEAESKVGGIWSTSPSLGTRVIYGMAGLVGGAVTVLRQLIRR